MPVIKCVGLKGKPCYKKRIHGSGLSDDEWQTAEVLKKEVERVTTHFDRARRLVAERDDPRHPKKSYAMLAKDKEYWRGQKNMVCYIASDIAHLFQEQDSFKRGDPRAFREGAFMQATGCAN